MSRSLIFAFMFIGGVSFFLGGCSKETPQKPLPVTSPVTGLQDQVLDGGALFKQYCASCHPDGGNVNDPGRNLHGSALRARRITTPDDVIRIMRNPVSRMIRFDAAMLSDRDARAIAEYVLKTYR